MVTNSIKLFVMSGCQLCPQMERVFENLHQSGDIQSLDIIDVTQSPELAEPYNIRSVPYYLINGIAFSGLKSITQIKQLLRINDETKWQEKIKLALSAGEIDSVQAWIETQAEAGTPLIQLLKSNDTDLLVRIGLSAVIESMASSHTLGKFEKALLELSNHTNEQIAIDGMYYLSLLASPNSLKQLCKISKSNASDLMRDQARELLEDI